MVASYSSTNLTSIVDSSKTNTSLVKLSIDRKTFEKRSKVSLSLSSADTKTLMNGNFSISVRRADDIRSISVPSATNAICNKIKFASTSKIFNEPFYLPELRGELFSGTVAALEPKSLVKGLKLAVSIAGDPFYFNVVTTDNSGNFYFNINQYYAGKKIKIDILSKNADAYDVTMNSWPSIDYASLTFAPVVLDANAVEKIASRSIHNQIENSFFSVQT